MCREEKWVHTMEADEEGQSSHDREPEVLLSTFSMMKG